MAHDLNGSSPGARVTVRSAALCVLACTLVVALVWGPPGTADVHEERAVDAYVETDLAINGTIHLIPQLSHNCSETGKHCCAADAPFSCCCSQFKERMPHTKTLVIEGKAKQIRNGTVRLHP